mgnify:CR=1 FL=1
MSHRQIKLVKLSEKTDKCMQAFAARDPGMSALTVVNRAQKIFLVALLLGLIACFALDWLRTLIVLNGLCLAFYLVTVTYKAVLIRLSIREHRELSFPPEQVMSVRDEDLPVYTILVPMYHEASSLPRLLDGLRSLDYPKDKLDVMLLLEEDDEETHHAARLADLPRYVRAVITPECQPKTKPKACNLGLAMARGDYLVIYDAEDRPEPDQLKKAVLGFRKVGEDVVCLQAKLNFYNQRQNLLTRWFTTDYSTWFDLFLPGLDRLGVPIPLGGTSNHFRVDALRKLFGWDPYNVTEDCELGVRIAQKGLKTRMLDSTTWEEACSRVGYWVRQRSRWVKGYVQTYLCHMRRPLRLTRKVGLLGAFSFHVIVGGTFLGLLISPLCWLLTLLWFISKWQPLVSAVPSVSQFSHFMADLFPYPLILWGLLCLFVGNFIFLYGAVLATHKRGYFDLVKYCLIVPVYWFLLSIGAWKGFLQLFTRPSFWEKTRHGLDLPGAAVDEAG